MAGSKSLKDFSKVKTLREWHKLKFGKDLPLYVESNKKKEMKAQFEKDTGRKYTN
jgi:hypothetical protein